MAEKLTEKLILVRAGLSRDGFDERKSPQHLGSVDRLGLHPRGLGLGLGQCLLADVFDLAVQLPQRRLDAPQSVHRPRKLRDGGGGAAEVAPKVRYFNIQMLSVPHHRLRHDSCCLLLERCLLFRFAYLLIELLLRVSGSILCKPLENHIQLLAYQADFTDSVALIYLQ